MADSGSVCCLYGTYVAAWRISITLTELATLLIGTGERERGGSVCVCFGYLCSLRNPIPKNVCQVVCTYCMQCTHTS
jgi:hypothetical protein